MRQRVDAVVQVVLVILMALLVVDVVWQVFTRYVLNSPSTFTDEVARFLLIWVGLLGGAYASGRNAHVAIDLLPGRLRLENRVRLNLFIDALIIVFVSLVLVIGGASVVYQTYATMQLTPTLQIPMAYVYLVGPISGLLVIFYKILDIRASWRSLRRGSVHPVAQGSHGEA